MFQMKPVALLELVPQTLPHVVVSPPCHTHRALMTLLLSFTQAKAHKSEILLYRKVVIIVNEFNRCSGPSWCSQGA